MGIGGIGMSALARYFMHEGCAVAGYDRTATPLTAQLEAEGALIHYDDSVDAIPAEFLERDTVVVYTPAVPADHSEMCYFHENGYRMLKRSQMLGELSVGKYVMAVAGTHGKTTTSTLVSWLNYAAAGEGSASWVACRRISRAIWCWAQVADLLLRQMSSTARSCSSIQIWLL